MKKNLSEKRFVQPKLNYYKIKPFVRYTLTEKSFFSGDAIRILLNMFVDNDHTNDIAIINGYTATCVKNVREFINEKNRMIEEGQENSEDFKKNETELKKSMRSFKNSMKYDNPDGIFKKKVIAYIHNDNDIHWTCTFIFNVVSFISKWEYKYVKTKEPRFKNKKQRKGKKKITYR